MTSSEFDLSEILKTWDTEEENRKARFIEVLYDFYRPGNGLYTGLYQRFQKDLMQNSRDKVLEGFCDIADLFLVPDKI